MNTLDIKTKLRSANDVVHSLPETLVRGMNIGSQLNDISGILSDILEQLAPTKEPSLIDLYELCRDMLNETVEDWGFLAPGEEQRDMKRDKRSWDTFYQRAQEILNKLP